MGNQSCSGNSYRAIKQSIVGAECIAGISTVIGLKDEFGKGPPILLFGELHDDAYNGTQCTWLSALLRETLSCERKCRSNNTFDVFIEVCMPAFFDRMSDPERAKYNQPHMSKFASLLRVFHETAQMCNQYEDIVHPFEWFPTQRMYYEKEDEFEANYVDTMELLTDMFEIDGVDYNKHDKGNTPNRNVRTLVMRAAKNELDTRTYDALTQAVDKYFDVLETHFPPRSTVTPRFGFLLILFNDALTSRAMYRSKKTVVLGYWGAAHILHQAYFLQYLGYKIDFSLHNHDPWEQFISWARNARDIQGDIDAAISHVPMQLVDMVRYRELENTNTLE